MSKTNAVLQQDNKGLRADLKESKSEVSGMKDDITKLQAMVEAITGAEDVKPSTDAIDNPVAIRKVHEAAEEEIGAKNTLRFERDESTGESLLVGTGIYDMDSPEFNEKQANIAFMEEMVTVMVAVGPEKDSDPRFEIGVNGVMQFFLRGKEVTVKRKFVEGLARAKPVILRNKEFINSEGISTVEYPETRTLRYPFSVLKDDNPIGHQWLTSVLRQQ